MTSRTPADGRSGAALGRRRVLTLVAAAAGSAVFSNAGAAGAAPARERRAVLYEWRGQALGAEARLRLAHPDRRVCAEAATRCLDEVARLERIFSLYDPDSELARLNRDGRLAGASHDLRRLLSIAKRLGALSGGAFDPTVQPLWELYATHFADGAAPAAGPSAAAIDRARRLVDYRAIRLEDGGVAFARPGMKATLNGIAQGYIADRATAILRRAGFDRVLVELGETVALTPPGARPSWRIAVADPVGRRPVAALDIGTGAVATSAGLATRFDAEGRYTHLFDPATGASAARWRSVTVVAGNATLADGLSTALAVAPPALEGRLLAAGGAREAIFQAADGRLRRRPA